VKVLIVGGDGFCGWATSLYLSRQGYDVTVLDSLVRREWDREHGLDSLVPIASIRRRLREWTRRSGATITFEEVDVTDYDALSRVVRYGAPDAVVHFGQQRSAPFSMIDREHAMRTHLNNTVGNLNLLWALREHASDAHLVKLGTMGEYGTPNIDIEEGFIAIEHNGRSDRLPFPKQPGSFYHLTKVSDSDQIFFACRVWGLRATDLNQGVVYGTQTAETALSPALANRYDYDHIFGTVINRFCVQAALEHPLTVYGEGTQTRSFIDIRDTVHCVEIALANPAARGEYRVFNQFTETFSVAELAERIARVAGTLGMRCEVAHLPNPRVESETHYYTCVNTNLRSLGLTPTLLSDETIAGLIAVARAHIARADPRLIPPRVPWTGEPDDRSGAPAVA
jgi:UDP-sulfoquinovose synthase